MSGGAEPAGITRATVERLLAVVAQGDIVSISADYADNIDFRVNWPEMEIGGAVPWIRPRATAEDMADHFRTLAHHARPAEGGTSIERILVDGEEAVVIGTIRCAFAAGAPACRARFALHLTVQAGRIVRHHVYEDSLAVWRAWTAAAT